MPTQSSPRAAPPKKRRLEVEDVGDVTVVRFNDRRILDERNIDVIGSQLMSLVTGFGRRRLLLNFAAVEALASTMAGKLLALYRAVEAAGGRLALCQVQPTTAEIFRILGLTRWVASYDHEQEGLASFE